MRNTTIYSSSMQKRVQLVFPLLCFSFFSAAVFKLSTTQKAAKVATNDKQPEEFSWLKLTPSRDLQWKDCFSSRQCARLIVPLDHSEPTRGEAIIALIRVPASVSADSESYRGPILFNPGGPGGSGVNFLQGENGEFLKKIVGPQFDLVSFDPRGIGQSLPRASFFKTTVERLLMGYGLGVVNNTDEGIARTWARAHIVGQLAAESDGGYLKYMNTEQTARDMLTIVKAYGRTKIQYWGFSYGTILGATFATLFPDKIERMVLDGVVHADEYYSLEGIKSLDDIDKVLESFFTGCAEAGPNGCAFWAPRTDDIRNNLTTLYNTIRSKPLPVKSERNYGVFDYNMLRLTVFSSLYSPYLTFPLLADELAQIVMRNASASFDKLKGPEPYRCGCNSPDNTAPDSDAQVAIMCNDGPRIPRDLKSSEEYFNSLTISSPGWAEIWASIRLGCIGWPEFPKDNFRGPFEANTSHPLLFVGNTADPVTPLAAAKKMAQGFPSSVVLTQNSAGHCSISAPSLCTPTHIRHYFIDGTLPEPGTICEPIGKPFDQALTLENGVAGQGLLSVVDSMTNEEQEILSAVTELSRRPIIMPFHPLALSSPY